MLPGDYIAFKFSNKINTTISGLSEGIFWDFKKDDVADFLLEHYGIDKAFVPEIVDTFGEQSLVNSKGEEEIVQMEIDHYCESKFVFHKQGKKLEKCINQFLLETKMIDENTPNDNYELNQKSILNTIHKLVEYEVAE